jgi:hypothetical protein
LLRNKESEATARQPDSNGNETQRKEKKKATNIITNTECMERKETERRDKERDCANERETRKEISANRNTSGALVLLLFVLVNICKKNNECPSICNRLHRVSHNSQHKHYQYLRNTHKILNVLLTVHHSISVQ